MGKFKVIFRHLVSPCKETVREKPGWKWILTLGMMNTEYVVSYINYNYKLVINVFCHKDTTQTLCSLHGYFSCQSNIVCHSILNIACLCAQSAMVILTCSTWVYRTDILNILYTRPCITNIETCPRKASWGHEVNTHLEGEVYRLCLWEAGT